MTTETDDAEEAGAQALAHSIGSPWTWARMPKEVRGLWRLHFRAALAAYRAAQPVGWPVDELTRPIIGIEHRTAQEVFDIMSDRIRRAALRRPAPEPDAGEVDAVETAIRRALLESPDVREAARAVLAALRARPAGEWIARLEEAQTILRDLLLADGQKVCVRRYAGPSTSRSRYITVDVTDLVRAALARPADPEERA